jgi:peptidyl-prolyl cis-trans isomerase SurA
MKSLHAFTFVFTLGLTVALSGCSKQAADLVLAEVGPEKLTIAEYERQLLRNHADWEAAKKLPVPEKERFLDLLIKYRLKLLDAYRQHIDKDPEVLKEMAEYKVSLAASLLLDKLVVKPGLRRTYERLKEEIRASHILISVPQNASPADTLGAWQKASDLLKRAQAGEDFGRLAAQYSEDYSTRQTGGDVYYFTTGYMVPPFEDACYQLQPGQISPALVRTQYGYHIVKVTDRKPSRGKIRASHILIRFGSTNPTPEDTLKAYAQVRALLDSLHVGANFADLARDYSEDVGSAVFGGDLGFFERRRAVQQFDEVAFSLPVGQVSDIVRTQYGYHLIMVTAEQPLSSMGEMRQTLRDLYQNHRYTYDYTQFLERTKTEVGFKLYTDVVDSLAASLNSAETFADSGWDDALSPQLRNGVVFSFAGVVVPPDSVVSLLKRDPEFSKLQATSENIRKAVDRVAERSVMRYRARNVESEYPQFERRLKEYEEGILLYRMEQQRVWDKIVVNDSLLHDYFEKNRERYRIPARVKFSEILVLGDSSRALELLDSLKSGVDFNEFAARRSDRPKSNENKGDWGFRSPDENELTRRAATMEVGEISKPIRYEGGYSIIKVTGKEEARLKTYDEALPELAGHYHDFVANRLEGEWISALRKEYKVDVRPEKLGSAFAGPRHETDD